MSPERYRALMADPDAKLTLAEVAEGWRFCSCEWDGLLIRQGDPEAEHCTCFFTENGTVQRPTCPKHTTVLFDDGTCHDCKCGHCELPTAPAELDANEGLCQPCRMARDERLKEAG